MSMLLLTAGIFGQNRSQQYDSVLAKSLGADDYGMKEYVLVILKTGNNKTLDRSATDSLFKGHLANIRRLADDGKLVVAGPVDKNDMLFRGIFILNVVAFRDAEMLLQTDPAIHADLLGAELYHWYGSAALPEYLKVHAKIAKFDP